MRTGIFDTNLIKQMTRPGKRQRYDDVVIWLNQRGLVDFTKSLILLTPGGITEFLGYGTITVDADPAVLEATIQRIRNAPNNASNMQAAKNTLFEHFEKKIYASNYISKATLSRLVGREMNYVDDSLKEWLRDLLKDATQSGDSRKIIVNRIAMDHLQRVQWPVDISRDVYASFMVDVHVAANHGVSYNSTRSMWLIWQDFNQTKVLREMLQAKKASQVGHKSEVSNVLSLVELIENMRTLENLARFKNNEDFVDTEAIHFAVVGRYENGVLAPILFNTCDPIEAVLTRLLLFKWFYTATYRRMERNDEAIPPMAHGKIVQFDLKTLKPQYVVDVDQIPSSMDFLFSTKLEQWIEEQKKKFSV
ncbi:hypothetical protein DOM22_05255 [Bdellovibrio sp. ZAP7]|uniref:hypothetical protein n=1 Tax=Bdellovibrio sp. ZAP7 TaxID=2231053 RepID=UPI001156C8F2|nr:hypothetical protein [Bdellovibrio sp. ZAP7]QDK44608.1 hypothetical protein DOM22_05255 [Bdellovibrio sp. ZAP7]